MMLSVLIDEDILFIQVHLCEATRITDFLGDDFLVNRTGSRSMRVVVKMLKKNIDDHAR